MIKKPLWISNKWIHLDSSPSSIFPLSLPSSHFSHLETAGALWCPFLQSLDVWLLCFTVKLVPVPLPTDTHTVISWPHLLPRASATCRTLSCRQAWPGTRLHIPGPGVWLLEQLHKGANGTSWKCRATNSHWDQTMAHGIQERGGSQSDCFLSSFQDMNSPHNLTKEACLAEWVHW